MKTHTVTCDKCGKDCSNHYNTIDIVGKHSSERDSKALSRSIPVTIINKKIDLCSICTEQLITWLDFQVRTWLDF